MKGKEVLITGATAGIGQAAAEMLAAKGANITLVVRNRQKGEEVLSQLNAGGGDHRLFIMDFASLQSVRDGAASILDSGKKLDVVLNNAGIVNTQRRVTVDGYEEMFAVNHLAPFLLTGMLLPLVQDNTGRVINVSSGAHAFVKGIRFDDLHAEHWFATFKTYGQSKLANILYTLELADRLKPRGITANALHPGAVKTQLGTQNKGFMSSILPLLVAPFFKTAEQGASTSVFLASDEGIADTTGLYFVNCKAVKTRPWGQDRKAATKLWQISEELTQFSYQD